jgi:hypothetical protein
MFISIVIPAKARIQFVFSITGVLDARLRGHDVKK